MSRESSFLDPYQILQVHPKADLETIKHMHRYLAGIYHPDKAPANLKVEYQERMKQINAAYDILSNPSSKSKIDQKLDCPADSPNKSIRVRFDIADALIQAAVAGGGRNECFRRAINVLMSIANENIHTEQEYHALEIIADIQFNHLHDYSNAVVTFKRMAERIPRGIDLDELLIIIIECYSRTFQYSEALNTCQRAIQESFLTETIIQAWIIKGDLLDKLQRYEESLQAFKYVMQNYPNTDEAAYSQYRLARVLDSGMKRYPESINEYRKVLTNYGKSKWAADCQWRIDYIQRKHIEKKGWWQ
jgi:tetratricopeptide (TPR) repeat protein